MTTYTTTSTYTHTYTHLCIAKRLDESEMREFGGIAKFPWVHNSGNNHSHGSGPKASGPTCVASTGFLFR